jgi:hypothetical protein
VVVLVDRSGANDPWQVVAANDLVAELNQRFGTELPVGTLKVFPPPNPAALPAAVWKIVTKLYGAVPDEIALILVTPGRVGNEDAALRALTPLLHSREPRIRLLAVGIDTAVNTGFLNRMLAVAGRGAVETASTPAEIPALTARLADRLSRPSEDVVGVAADGFEIDEPTLTPPQRTVEGGGALAVWGRYRGNGDGAAVVTVGGEKVTARGRASRNPGLSATWARQYVRDLEDRFARGDGDKGDLARRITETALRFGILCRFTAFVAVERSVVVNGSGPAERVIVPVDRAAAPSVRQESEFSVAVDEGGDSVSSIEMPAIKVKPQPPGLEETSFGFPLAAQAAPSMFDLILDEESGAGRGDTAGDSGDDFEMPLDDSGSEAVVEDSEMAEDVAAPPRPQATEAYIDLDDEAPSAMPAPRSMPRGRMADEADEAPASRRAGPKSEVGCLVAFVVGLIALFAAAYWYLMR